MKVEKIEVGFLKENCYLLEKDHTLLIIDPGDEIDKILEKINNRRVIGVLVTHSHFDHVGALSYFSDNKIYSFHNLEEKEYHFGPFNFEVIYTPGHSKDSISFYFKEEKIFFSGDFIFYENIGRYDMPTGDYKEMLNSINKIKKYPKNITIYPGHGISTNLEHELKYNSYF